MDGREWIRKVGRDWRRDAGSGCWRESENGFGVAVVSGGENAGKEKFGSGAGVAGSGRLLVVVDGGGLNEGEEGLKIGDGDNVGR